MPDFTETKQDLRVARTEKALVQALCTLLAEQSFQKITVHELCETAAISRATFYMHFEDKFHLLRFTLSQFRRKFTSRLSGADKDTSIAQIMDFTQEHGNIFRNLLLEDNSRELLHMFNTMFAEHFTEELNRLQAEGKTFPLPIEMMAVFAAGGMSNLLLWWVSGNCRLSKEEMTACLVSIATRQKECGLGPFARQGDMPANTQ